jgi:hypothetical protein
MKTWVTLNAKLRFAINVELDFALAWSQSCEEKPINGFVWTLIARLFILEIIIVCFGAIEIL